MQKFKRIYGGNEEEKKDTFTYQTPRKPLDSLTCSDKRFEKIELMPSILSKHKRHESSVAFDKQTSRDAYQRCFV